MSNYKNKIVGFIKFVLALVISSFVLIAFEPESITKFFEILAAYGILVALYLLAKLIVDRTLELIKTKE